MNLNRKISKIAILEQKQKTTALDPYIISVIRQLLIDEENQVSHASVLMDLVINIIKKEKSVFKKFRDIFL